MSGRKRKSSGDAEGTARKHKAITMETKLKIQHKSHFVRFMNKTDEWNSSQEIGRFGWLFLSFCLSGPVGLAWLEGTVGARGVHEAWGRGVSTSV